MVTSSTPIPTPATKRHRSRLTAVFCAAITRVAAVYQIREAVKIARRPNRSATREKTKVPMNRPAKVAAANVAWSVRPNRPLAPAWKTPALISPGET